MSSAKVLCCTYLQTCVEANNVDPDQMLQQGGGGGGGYEKKKNKKALKVFSELFFIFSISFFFFLISPETVKLVRVKPTVCIKS